MRGMINVVSRSRLRAIRVSIVLVLTVAAVWLFAVDGRKQLTFHRTSTKRSNADFKLEQHRVMAYELDLRPVATMLIVLAAAVWLYRVRKRRRAR